MHRLGSFAHELTSSLRGMFQNQSPLALNLSPGYVGPPERENATMRNYDPVTRQWSDPVPVQIIFASVEEEAEGLARLQRCLPAWQVGPALYIEKPHTALLVSLSACSYDSRAFRLDFTMWTK